MKLLGKLGEFIECLFEQHKFVRRATVGWAVWLITYIAFIVMQPEVLLAMTAAGATVVTAFVGILATVTGLYIRARELDDKRDKEKDNDTK